MLYFDSLDIPRQSMGIFVPNQVLLDHFLPIKAVTLVELRPHFERNYIFYLQVIELYLIVSSFPLNDFRYSVLWIQSYGPRITLIDLMIQLQFLERQSHTLIGKHKGTDSRYSVISLEISLISLLTVFMLSLYINMQYQTVLM